MPMVCKVCSSPHTEAINEALLDGRSHRSIASEHGMSAASVFRHKRNHLPATLVKARDLRDQQHADGLLGRIQHLVDRAENILDKAEEAGNLSAANGAMREMRNSIELLAKATGELSEQHLHVHEPFVPRDIWERIADRIEEEARNPRPRLDLDNSPFIYSGDEAIPRAIEVGGERER